MSSARSRRLARAFGFPRRRRRPSEFRPRPLMLSVLVRGAIYWANAQPTSPCAPSWRRCWTRAASTRNCADATSHPVSASFSMFTRPRRGAWNAGTATFSEATTSTATTITTTTTTTTFPVQPHIKSNHHVNSACPKKNHRYVKFDNDADQRRVHHMMLWRATWMFERSRSGA